MNACTASPTHCVSQHASNAAAAAAAAGMLYLDYFRLFIAFSRIVGVGAQLLILGNLCLV